jgi:hypothetical protein
MPVIAIGEGDGLLLRINGEKQIRGLLPITYYHCVLSDFALMQDR